MHFMGMFFGFAQSKTYELKGENDDDLYPYMRYWKEVSVSKKSLNEAVYQLEQGSFKTFDPKIGRNLGLFPEPIWFNISVKNISDNHHFYWWTFYSHADSIIVYEQQRSKWRAIDTLLRNKVLKERKAKHRALTHPLSLGTGEERNYLIKIINSRHTQNSFISLTTPTYHLLWENGFYWTIGSFIGIFLLTGAVSLIMGLVTRERTFMLFFVYMLTVSALTLYNELMIPIIKNKSLFSLLNHTHPLPLSLIATCLNFYMVDFIFGKVKNTKPLHTLNILNTTCLALGSIALVGYMLFTNSLHSGQTLFLFGWYGILACIFISIVVTALKIIILSIEYKKLYFGIPFLLLIIIVNPATYNLNYSGIFSFYEITYPNYFFWFVSGEFIFIVFLIGWRYKKDLEYRHKLEIKFNQMELSILSDERKQIARDLHDDLGATINTIKLLATNSYPEDKRLIETVTIASNDIRVFYNKLSHKTTDASLRASIEKLVMLHNSYKRVKFSCIFSGDEALLSDIHKENIYKIVSEICNNTLKHAQATDATIQFLIDPTTAQLIAEDNGTGFSAEKVQDVKGMGIKNVKERVALMKGKLHISSNKGNTTYIIDIPLKK